MVSSAAMAIAGWSCGPEADVGGEHRVRRVLGELREADVHHDQAIVVARERHIECAHQFRGARVVHAKHHPIRSHDVLDRRSLLKEVRVGDHVEFNDGAPNSSCAPISRPTMSADPPVPWNS